MKCLKCGSENSENAFFCNNCGTNLKNISVNPNPGSAVKIPAGKKPKMIRVNLASAEKTADSENCETSIEVFPVSESVPMDGALKTNVPIATPESTKYAEEADNKRLDRIYRPMRKRDWLAVFVLCAIPVLNIVMLFIWSFSPNANKSKKSYAQLVLIITGITVLLLTATAFILWSVFGDDLLSSLTATFL